MSDHDDVFNQAGNDDQSKPAPESNPLDELVGEDKKYKTIDEAVKAFYHAQNHIANLEQENQEYRERMSEWEKQQQGSREVLDALEQRNTPSQEAPTSATTDEEAVRKLVEQVVEQKSSAQVKAENLAKANQVAQQMYGDQASERVAEAARNLGITVEMLRSTAESSPRAFQKLISDNIQQEAQQPPVRGVSPSPSTVNTQQMPQGASSGEKNFAYYNKMRRENPRQYKTVQVQREMMQQRTKLGDKFYS